MTDTAERKMRFLYALRSKGVTDIRVLTAMERIDRGTFVKGLFADRKTMRPVRLTGSTREAFERFTGDVEQT